MVRSVGLVLDTRVRVYVILSPPHLLHCLGPNFGAIELDDIRIERLDDIESGLKSNIEVLKVIIFIVH